MKVCIKWSRSHDQDGRHGYKYQKRLKIFFFRTRRSMILKLSMKHVGMELYKVYINHDPGMTLTYCKFGNFRVTFISRIFYFQIISEFLNSRVSVHLFYKVYCDSLLARTLNSRGNQFAKIKFSRIFPDLQYFTARST